MSLRFPGETGPHQDCPFDSERDAVTGPRRHRLWTSRQFHRLGSVTSHAWAGAVVLFLALGWVVWGAGSGFPSYWPEVLESTTSIVAVVMLFAIQHLHARDQTVVHRKLDEILRSIPRADNRLIAFENAPDEHLEARTEIDRQDRLP
jgi:low affinity Fe/Cu permease